LISATQLRQLYRGRGVTVQLPQPRCGKPKLEAPEKQEKAIQACRLKYLNAKYSEYEVIAVDSAIFSPKCVRQATFAPQCDPIIFASKWLSSPRYLCVHSAASSERGVIHTKFKMPITASKRLGIAKEGGFNSVDILEFYKELKAKSPRPFAIFRDGGSYQSSPEIKAWFEENNVPEIINVKYRPDFNGIEAVWNYAKTQYKSLVMYHRAMRLDWD
jgi:hypothetical protein